MTPPAAASPPPALNNEPPDPKAAAGATRHKRQVAAWIAIVAAGALLSVLGAIAVKGFEDEHLEARIDRRADNIHLFLSETIPAVGHSVASLKILFENSDDVSRREFERAATTLIAENPEIGVFQWVPRIDAGGREEFLARMRRESGTSFEMVDVSSDGVRSPAPVRPESWPIAYVHPLAGNEVALGFDLASGPTRATLDKARASGRLVLGPPRRLVQKPEGGAAFFFIDPVFSWDAQGARTFAGFIQGISPASRVLAPVVQLAEKNELDFDLTDFTDGEAEPFFSSLTGEMQPGGSKFLQEHRFERLGRLFRLRCIPRESLLSTQRTHYSQATLLGGLLATGLLGLYLQGILRRTSTIQELVDRRTGELTELNRNLAREAAQRREAEDGALRARESFQVLVDSVEGIVWQADTWRDRFVFVNRRAEEILGYPVRQWLDTPEFWTDRLHPDDRAHASRIYREGVMRGGAFEHTYRMIAADGRTVWLRDHVRVVEEPGRPMLAHGVIFDVTRQRASDEALRRDAHFLANVSDALVVTDLDGIVTFWNTGAAKIFGWSAAERIGKPLDHAIGRAVVAAMGRNLAAVAAGKTWTGEWRTRRKDGTRVVLDSRATRFLDSEGRPSGIFTISRDITERKVREKEKAAFLNRLQHTQKLESLGVLAGGIAHDFNNLLTGILGHSSLLAMDLPPEHPMKGSLAIIEKSALRAAELCQQMLAYAGRGRFVIEPVDVAGLVRDTTKLIEASVAKGADIRYSHEPDTPPVRADATQLRQVVMNLVINASEALGENGGRVRVSTGTTRVSRAALATAVHGHDRPAGTYVFLDVEDNGSGIPPGDIRRIFEPFHSTKFTGRGLGLAAVLGIVRSHSGALIVTSTPGEGTLFQILLPPAAAEFARRSETPASAPPPGMVTPSS